MAKGEVWKQTSANRWTQLHARRLQAYPSSLTKSGILIDSSLPDWLTVLPVPINQRLMDLQVFKETKHKEANHVLVNEYQAGQGIMPHEDGGAYAPVVATISLGGSIVLDLYDKYDTKPDEPQADDIPPMLGAHSHRILQENRSLLVTTGKAYADVLHGIANVKVDEQLNEHTIANWNLLGDKNAFADGINERSLRVSLTYRDVLKVSKIRIGSFGRGR